MAEQIKFLPSDTDIVLVTMGGNDAKFTDIIVDCYFSATTLLEGPCRDSIKEAGDFLKNDLSTQLDFRLKEIKKRLKPDAVIV